jgi:hypothetical protein
MGPQYAHLGRGILKPRNIKKLEAELDDEVEAVKRRYLKRIAEERERLEKIRQHQLTINRKNKGWESKLPTYRRER